MTTAGPIPHPRYAPTLDTYPCTKYVLVTGACADADVPLQVVIRPELSEQLVTTGDIGLPVSRIEKMFPEVCAKRLVCSSCGSTHLNYLYTEHLEK